MPPSSPEFLEFSKSHVFFFLVSNGLKFTKVGGVTILVIKTKQNATNNYRIEVVDTGIGIREEQLENLFKRFNQAKG